MDVQSGMVRIVSCVLAFLCVLCVKDFRFQTEAPAMTHNLYNTLQEFKIGAGQDRQVLLAAGAGEGAGSEDLAAAGVHPHRARVGAAQLRRQEGDRGARAGSSPAGARTRRAWTRSRSWSRASCCRTSPACRCSPTSPPCAASPDTMDKNPKIIEPLVPVDLVVDHSVQVDHYGSKDALDLNMKLEFQRNEERYQFMKWGMQAFDTFKVVPPGIGIVHQVNLEYLARGVHQKDGVYYPDTLVGTDCHTTMINGIGVVGWGVGGIEAEAGMLGQPVYFLTPDVVGVNLKGKLRGGVHRHRPGADRHRDAAQGQGGRQVRRVLRRGRREPGGAGSRHHRQHGAGVRRDHGLLPGRRRHHRVLPRHRPHPGRDRRLRGLLQGAGPVRHSQGRRDRLQPGARARPGQRRALARRAQAAAGPHRDRQGQEHVHQPVLQAGGRERLRQEARGPGASGSRPATASTSARATC